jgi:hypothetical protein
MRYTLVASILAVVLFPFTASAEDWVKKLLADEQQKLIADNAANMGKNLGEAIREAGRQKQQFNADIAKARATFFATYPNDAAATARFRDLLWQKDLYFLDLQYLTGREEDIVKAADQLSGGEIDGGIPSAARPEFSRWVLSVHDKFVANKTKVQGGLFGIPERLIAAVEASKKYYEIYVIARDWAEFDLAGREPAGFNDPDRYGAMLVMRYEKLPWPEAVQQYAAMSQALDRDVVRRAAEKIHAARKTKLGSIDNPDALGLTPTRMTYKKGLSGGDLEDSTVPAPEGVTLIRSSNPLDALITLAADFDSRRYLMHLIAPTAPQLRILRARTTSEYQAEGGMTYDWDFAQMTFQRYCIGFSQEIILAAAEKVRTSRRYLASANVYEPGKTLGVKHSQPYSACRDLLMAGDPKGYVRAMLCFHQKQPDAAGVDAEYQKLVAAYTEPKVLDVARKMAAREPDRFFASFFDDDYDTLMGALAGTISLEPKIKKTIPVFDNPEYLAWRAFKPGASVQYYSVSWHVNGPNKIIDYPRSKTTYKLQSADDPPAKLLSTTISYFQKSVNPPNDREEFIQGKIRAPRADDVVTTGIETIDVLGKPLLCRWKTTKRLTKDEKTITETVWFNDQVPGGKVRRYYEIGAHQVGRILIGPSCSETTLLAYEGTPVNPIAPVTLPPGEKETPSGFATSRSPSAPARAVPNPTNRRPN